MHANIQRLSTGTELWFCRIDSYSPFETLADGQEDVGCDRILTLRCLDNSFRINFINKLWVFVRLEVYRLTTFAFIMLSALRFKQ